VNLSLLLEMAAEGLGHRVAVGPRESGRSYAELLQGTHRLAAWLAEQPVQRVGLIDVNSEAVPLLLFGSASAGLPFVPLNYRLSSEQLRTAVGRIAPATAVVGAGVQERLGPIRAAAVVPRETVIAVAGNGAGPSGPAREAGPDDVAVLLFTSGTTGDPKTAVLRHRHLASYVISTVEFMSAHEEEATLVSVPPYHVAGISAVLTSVYAGRRIVQVPSFDPEEWVSTALREGITHAMVVPTMLGRILDVVEERGVSLPSLRHVSYGGGRMPVPVIERALRVFPEVDFVNAYGLTETSSTIAVLGPEDHRAAGEARDEHARRRLGSVGRPLPTVEVEVRDPAGRRLPAGERGEICVRGEQVSGEYVGRSAEPGDGWFRTNDGGYLDEDGYLYVEGRLDDVIVRGAENISPGEVEDVLLAHPAVAEAAVVGVPDQEWGERVVAVVVPSRPVSETELQEWVRVRLRSSRTPEAVEFRDRLPYSDTGKLLRRVVRAEILAAARA
jgi:fatty-acyl-CoA synthase